MNKLLFDLNFYVRMHVRKKTRNWKAALRLPKHDWTLFGKNGVRIFVQWKFRNQINSIGDGI